MTPRKFIALAGLLSATLASTGCAMGPAASGSFDMAAYPDGSGCSLQGFCRFGDGQLAPTNICCAAIYFR